MAICLINFFCSIVPRSAFFLSSQHHMMVLLYLICPTPWPYVRPFMGPIMSVEVNSWFSFARRVAWKRQHWSGDIFHGLFMVTWILTRVILYPLLMVVFCRIAYYWIYPPFESKHLPILFFPVHFYFCVMNLIWTRDLFTPIIMNGYKWAQCKLLAIKKKTY